MPRKVILLYDGHCVLCMRSVETLHKLKTNAVLETIPLQHADLNALLPDTAYEKLQAQIHVIDSESGHVYKGADAIVFVVSTVSSLRWLSALYRFPGLKPVADFLYRWIAKHRYKLFGQLDDCEAGTCELHKHPQEQERRKQ